MFKGLKLTLKVDIYCRHLSTGGTTFAKLNFMNIRYKKWANDLALENFDEFYKPVFKHLWPSIRLALLTQHKYCCFLNNFGDVEKSEELMNNLNAINIRVNFEKRLQLLETRKFDLKGDDPTEVKNDQLESELEIEESARSAEIPVSDDAAGRFAPHYVDKSFYFNQYVPVTKLHGVEDWVDESDYFDSSLSLPDKFQIQKIESKPRQLPKCWNIFAYNRGDFSTYPEPSKGLTGVLNYYLLDATSILPAFVLDPSPGDTILDMCSAPGGKALAILQTLYDVKMVCVDDQLSRAKRLQHVFETYIPTDSSVTWPRVIVSDGRRYGEQVEQFDKILVDVPCTTDRRSVNEKENNIFTPNRIKERTQIPTVQAELLTAALKAVKVGGSVVYSTCSLSPVQNDNVVLISLKNMKETSSATFAVHDMSKLLYPFRFLMRFHPSTQYGYLVIPFLPCNYGPLYVSKITKLSG